MSALTGFQGVHGTKRDLLTQSVLHKCMAYITGQDAHKSEHWLETAWESIDSSITLLVEDLTASLKANSTHIGPVLQALQALHEVIPEAVCEWRMYASRDVLRGVRDAGSELIDPAAPGTRGHRCAADWRCCLMLVAEAARPLIEALQMALDFDDGEEVTHLLQLEDELFVMEARATSAQARLQGDELLQRTLRQRRERLDRKQQAQQPQKQAQQQQQPGSGPAAANAAAAGAGADAARTGRDQSKPQQQQQQQQAPEDEWQTYESRKHRKAKRQNKQRASQQQQQQQERAPPGNGLSQAGPAAAAPAATTPAGEKRRATANDDLDDTARAVPMDTEPAATAAAEAEAAAAGAEAAAAEVEAAAESAELEGLLAAVDLFKSAALLARERDLQAEAQALSRLGHLYKVCETILDPILVPHRTNQPSADGTAAAAGGAADVLVSRCADERSRDAFLRVLLLVDALPHKISLMMEDWYREARDAISAYQASRAAAEEQQKEAERAPVREALRDELQALYDAANKGWVDLIKHCYDKHPPLNPANRLAADAVFDADHGKELLRRAILAYHPDKQGGQGVAFSWQVMAEEITKQLTRKYECFK